MEVYVEKHYHIIDADADDTDHTVIFSQPTDSQKIEHNSEERVIIHRDNYLSVNSPIESPYATIKTSVDDGDDDEDEDEKSLDNNIKPKFINEKSTDKDVDNTTSKDVDNTTFKEENLTDVYSIVRKVHPPVDAIVIQRRHDDVDKAGDRYDDVDRYEDADADANGIAENASKMKNGGMKNKRDVDATVENFESDDDEITIGKMQKVVRRKADSLPRPIKKTLSLPPNLKRAESLSVDPKRSSAPVIRRLSFKEVAYMKMYGKKGAPKTFHHQRNFYETAPTKRKPVIFNHFTKKELLTKLKIKPFWDTMGSMLVVNDTIYLVFQREGKVATERSSYIYKIIVDLESLKVTKQRLYEAKNYWFSGLSRVSSGEFVLTDLKSEELISTKDFKTFSVFERDFTKLKFNVPRGVAVIDDVIHVADTGNNRIQIIDKSGALVEVYGKSELKKPYDVINISENKVCVHDAEGLVMFNKRGRALNFVSDRDALGISCDSEHRPLVCSTQGIQVFNSRLEAVTLCYNQLHSPLRIGMLANDHVVVFDRATRKEGLEEFYIKIF